MDHESPISLMNAPILTHSPNLSSVRLEGYQVGLGDVSDCTSMEHSVPVSLPIPSLDSSTSSPSPKPPSPSPSFLRDSKSIFTLDVTKFPIKADIGLDDKSKEAARTTHAHLANRQSKHILLDMKFRARTRVFRKFWKDNPQREVRVRQAMEHVSAAASIRRRTIPFTGIPYDQSLYCLGKDQHINRPGHKFPLEFCVEDPEHALMSALKEHDRSGPGESERAADDFTFWVDASQILVPKVATGIGVAFRESRHSPGWATRGYCVRENIPVTEAETLAIAQALHIALEIPIQPGATITVYSDSQFAIMSLFAYNEEGCLDKRPLRQATFYLIASKAQELKRRGAQTCIKWVPAHSHVPGNVLADRIALKARRELFRRKRK